jgi:saccharopine dehydrogenase (NAD+, L-lysine-forming)
MSESATFDFPEIGPRRAYLLFHEEEESLVRHLHGLKQIRFWMTFSEDYLTHLRVLQNVGMTRITPVQFQGRAVIPLQFLKALLPDPADLGHTTTGKTCIGCIFTGIHQGKTRKLMLYNVSDHRRCFEEVGAQAVSYTTGVSAMIGAKMMLSGVWKRAGVFNLEQFDPDPFMEDLNRYGLPWQQQEL